MRPRKRPDLGSVAAALLLSLGCGPGRAQDMLRHVDLNSPQMIEAELEPGYDVAPRHHVKLLLTTGESITGHVVVFLPPGHERLSDYARMDERFRYVELPDRTLLVNSAHIVALTEVDPT